MLIDGKVAAQLVNRALGLRNLSRHFTFHASLLTTFSAIAVRSWDTGAVPAGSRAIDVPTA